MFRKPTVIVIGAGASAELSLPAGGQLKQKIAEGLRFRFDYGQQISGDHQILDALRRKFPKDTNRINSYSVAGNKLAESIATFPSIDEALHWWRAEPEIVELGKAAIVHYILEAEQKSPLAIKRSTGTVESDSASGSWLHPFISMALTAGAREGVVTAFDQVTFINFNYDRTIEQYIYWALQQRAGVEADIAAAVVSGLKIIRPYGSIGRLNWQDRHEVPYGGSSQQDIFAVSSNVRTFTERPDEFEVKMTIDGALEMAHTVIFLGFGFHQQNLALFQPESGSTRANINAVLATTLGIDSLNYSAISDRLESELGLHRPTLVPLTASQLLVDLRPTIAMSSS